MHSRLRPAAVFVLLALLSFLHVSAAGALVARPDLQVGGVSSTPVHAGADLQAAINAAACGDTLLLDAGATWVGTYFLPNKGCLGPDFITFLSSGVLPAAGVRVQPSDSPQLAHIVTNTAAAVFKSNFGASYYRFVGVEIASTVTTRIDLPTLVILGESGNDHSTSYIYAHTNAELPHHIEFDRVYFHGTTTGNLGQAIIAEANSFSMINSWIDEVHLEGIESHGIQIANAQGPFTFLNNYIAAAGMCFMSGGAGDTIAGNIPSNILWRDNYCTKKLSWYPQAAQVGGVYGGIPWTVKNCFELKKAKNVTVDHSVFEAAWVESQAGTCVLAQVSAKPAVACAGCFGGATLDCTWCTIANVSFTNSIVRHASQGFDILGSHPQGLISAPAADGFTIRNLLIYDITPQWGGPSLYSAAHCFQNGGGFKNITIDHVTCDNPGAGSQASTKAIFYSNNPLRPTLFMDNYTVTNSFMIENQYGLFCNGGNQGTACLNEMTGGGPWSWHHNVLPAVTPYITYPAGTAQPSLATFAASFVNRASADYRQALTSPYKNAASDGTDIGVNVALLPPVGPVAPTPPPVITPVPPPVSVCVTSPLTISNVKWPNAQAGSSRMDYTTNYAEASVLVTFGSPTTLKITDTRGCAATVTK